MQHLLYAARGRFIPAPATFKHHRDCAFGLVCSFSVLAAGVARWLGVEGKHMGHLSITSWDLLRGGGCQ